MIYRLRPSMLEIYSEAGQFPQKEISYKGNESSEIDRTNPIILYGFKSHLRACLKGGNDNG